MNKETKEDYAGRIAVAIRALDTIEQMLLNTSPYQPKSSLRLSSCI